jgi:hypothetical protein
MDIISKERTRSDIWNSSAAGMRTLSQKNGLDLRSVVPCQPLCPAPTLHYYVEMPATLVEMLISIEHQAMDREYTPEVWVSWPALAGTA